MISGEKYRHTMYGYWANRFDCQRIDFKSPCTKLIKEDDLVEKGKVYLYHIKDMLVVRMAPDLVEEIESQENYDLTCTQINDEKMGLLLGEVVEISQENTLVDYFLDPIDFTPAPPLNGYSLRQIDPKADDAVLRAFYDLCTEEDLDEAEIYVDEPDPIIFGLFEKDQMAAYASHRYWDDVIADIGVLVHPEYRNRGLGKKIVSNLCGWCIQNDVVPMYRVFTENKHSSRIPRSLGFKETVVIETLNVVRI